MRVLYLICFCVPLYASYNQWQGGSGNVTVRNNTTTITDGGGVWTNSGAANNLLRRLEIRNTNENQRLQIEVVNQIAVIGIYQPTTITKNIVNKVTVKNGGSIECDRNICSDGNSLYIGNNHSAQLTTLSVEAGGRINRNGYGRINVSGYLNTLSNAGQILGEGVVLGLNSRGTLAALYNNAGGYISAVTGRAGSNSNIEELINNANASIGNISSLIFDLRLRNVGSINNITGISTPTLENSGNITSVTNSTITTLTNTGGNLNTITNSTISTINVSGGVVSSVTNNSITNFNVSGGNVGVISNPQGQRLSNLNVSGGGVVGTLENIAITNLTNSANITNLTGSANINALNNTGTITNLTLNDNIGYNPNTRAHINGNVTNLTIQDFNIILQNNADVWNTHSLANQGANTEHLYMSATVGNLVVQPGAIKIALGQGVDKQDGIYRYDKVILNAPANSINFSHLTPAQGLELFDVRGVGFSLRGNVASSFGASVLQSVQLNDTRRIVIVQNILDSINFHHFYRTSIKRKEQNKEQASEDTQEQKIDTSHWQKYRTFAIPYGVYGDLSVNKTKSNTYASGLLAGIQKDLGALGIGIAYLGYEYNSTNSRLSVADAFLTANVAQGGLAHIKLLKSQENKQFYLKTNLRTTFAFLKFNAKEDRNSFDANTFTYHFGGAMRGGMAYYFNPISYIAPELGISYDLMGVAGFEIDKGVLANEIYPSYNVHLPQVSVSVKYYQAVGQFYRYSILMGGRYSPNNRPMLSFQNGIFSDEARIFLPSFYANIDANISRAISRVSELGVGYNGLVYNGGSSHSLSVKYVRWF